jgi:TRAP-type C4-dicarboxylate transport system substrate-binding protein
MPFGSVYTSLQTGVIDMAENGVNVYDSNKHYEVAPIMSMTEHEANCNLLWCSGKLWSSLSPEQQGWVREAATELSTKEPALAIDLEHKSRAKLEKIGVKFVADVDKSGFLKAAEPLQDKIAADLGPHATKILRICRTIS